MQWTDWLLGRDTEDLQIVRRIRVLLWWGSWAGLIGSILAILFSAVQPPPFAQAPWFVLALQILPQTAVPFMGWALVTILLEIHGLLASETDNEDEDENGLDEDDTMESPDDRPPAR
jgi:hypothetical protein